MYKLTSVKLLKAFSLQMLLDASGHVTRWKQSRVFKCLCTKLQISASILYISFFITICYIQNMICIHAHANNEEAVKQFQNLLENQVAGRPVNLPAEYCHASCMSPAGILSLEAKQTAQYWNQPKPSHWPKFCAF